MTSLIVTPVYTRKKRVVDFRAGSSPSFIRHHSIRKINPGASANLNSLANAKRYRVAIPGKYNLITVLSGYSISTFTVLKIVTPAILVG